MKKFLIAGFTASLLGSVAINQSAYAADPVASEFDWTGIYVGGHIGGGGADFSGIWDPSEDPALDPGDFNLNGWAAGAQLGYNHQFNSIVMGIEGDVTVTNWNDFEHHQNGASNYTSSMAGRVDLLASVRGRLGVAFDRSLIYVTGGLAMADASFDAVDPRDPLSLDFDDVGGVVGGGFEYAVADNVSLRAEGLYYFFGDKRSLEGTDLDSSSGDNVEFDDAVVARVGLNWLINSAAINQSAYAADPVASEFDWTGIYVGGHIGGGGADFSGIWDPSEDPALDPGDFNLNGWAAGAQLGYNHQIGSIVVGIEGDVTVTNWNDFEHHHDGASNFTSSMAGRVDLLASVRGRLGVAFDRSLIYVTGGLAMADASFDAVDPRDPLSLDFDDVGGVVGGGFEYAVADNVSLRAEGLYYFFGDKQSLEGTDLGSSSGDNVEFDDAVVARVGLNWLIN